jgi:hypothetical protein
MGKCIGSASGFSSNFFDKGLPFIFVLVIKTVYGIGIACGKDKRRCLVVIDKRQGNALSLLFIITIARNDIFIFYRHNCM